MENPIKMDDLGVPPFKETPILHLGERQAIPVEHTFEKIPQALSTSQATSSIVAAGKARIFYCWTIFFRVKSWTICNKNIGVV